MEPTRNILALWREVASRRTDTGLPWSLQQGVEATRFEVSPPCTQTSQEDVSTGTGAASRQQLMCCCTHYMKVRAPDLSQGGNALCQSSYPCAISPHALQHT